MQVQKNGYIETTGLITSTMEQALITAIKNNNIPKEEVIEVLENFGYKKLKEIKLSEYKEVTKALIGE